MTEETPVTPPAEVPAPLNPEPNFIQRLANELVAEFPHLAEVLHNDKEAIAAWFTKKV